MSKYAREEIAPKVREMDETATMDPGIIKGLFEQGVSDTKAPARCPDRKHCLLLLS